MGEARWLPLFVTADVSIDIINSVLRSAAKETKEDEDFENRWSLIRHTSQETAHKPSIAPISPFSSEFLNATIETLQDLVTTNCGEDGLGHDSKVYMDWLADDAFGVIDARTAEDDTILFCVRETVDAIQEAEVRLAWDKGTRGDGLLTRYMEDAAEMDEQDVIFLATDLTTTNTSATTQEALTTEQAKQKIDDWIDVEQQRGRPKWFEIRMVVGNAMKYSCGIWNIGPAAVLTGMKEQFDDEGVMRY